MANTKELQNRIKSIRDTRKITKAMYMMSSTKLRKAKQKLEDTEPYFNGLQEGIRDILLHFPNMEHLYFDNRPKDKKEAVKKKAFVVITGDKGMAGAYNHNVLKAVRGLIDGESLYTLMVVGEVGRHYFLNLGYHVDSGFVFSANNPSIHRSRVITEYIINLYNCEEFDEVYVIYTEMISSMRQQIHIERVLPLMTRDFVEREFIEKKKEDKIDNDWYTIYPSPKKVLEKLAYNYVTGYIYGVLVEGFASEENARMMSMKAATDNAEEMLSELSVMYNRVRQSTITQEITEVIGGVKTLQKNI